MKGKVYPALLITTLILALVALPASAGVLAEAAAQGQHSATGKVTAVNNDGFTLTLSDGTTQTFITNTDTKIDGTLAVAASATVVFREEGGKNIALQVTVKAEK